MTSYNIHQQIFSVSFASGIVTGCLGSQADLQQKMDESLQPSLDRLNIGPWRVVWGPVAWKLNPDDTSSSADHSFYVARNAAADWGGRDLWNTYVIAIAGTATNSDVDFHEDVDIDRIVDFETFASGGGSSAPVPVDPDSIDPLKAYIALGTANGVNRLLTIRSAGDGTTLSQFLRRIPAVDDTRIVFTGHSLGGALSPTIALTALKAGILSNISPGNTFAYPIAGPTPGNRPFADLFAESFPLVTVGPSAYQVWNANIWNHYDIVPHAWNIGSVEGQNLWDILRIYGDLPSGLALEVALAIVYETNTRITPSGIDYVPIQGSRILPVPAPPTPQTFDELLAIAGPQHVQEYIRFVGAPVAPSLCEPPNPQATPVLRVIDEARKRKNKNKQEGKGKL
ncbi:hypothetical protein BDN71DRAFT_140869 [Pleurotus eryngii]|uniref:Fungal lipase-type domain-containing protein n=1 Tax=Pleurotus eryngii TaxID=5323 RepID=A0A9P5ZNA6_PLEER|nr:hypothetical protein BDN71DRAFT_140869 [Pleurotus eryngii]